MTLRRASAAVVLLLAGLALLTDGGPDLHSAPTVTYGYVEHPVYKETVRRMREGAGYYDAMDATMRASCITSDPNSCGGPVETVRAFRLPTLFVLWRFGVPMWIGFVVLAALAGLAALHVHPLAGPPVTLYLLLIGWSRYTQAEPYAAALIIGGIVAYKYRRWAWAAGLMLVAALVRELAVIMLVGGLLAAWRKAEPRRPWVVASILWAAAMAGHAALASSFLVEHGTEAPLLLTGRVDTFTQFLGYGTGHWLVGLALWVLAGAALLRERMFDDLLLPAMVFPIVGLAVARPNWSTMVHPLLILFAVRFLGAGARRPSPRRDARVLDREITAL